MKITIRVKKNRIKDIVTKMVKPIKPIDPDLIDPANKLIITNGITNSEIRIISESFFKKYNFCKCTISLFFIIICFLYYIIKKRKKAKKFPRKVHIIN